MDWTMRIGALAIAAALLFVARRLHKAAGKNPRKTKTFAVILAFIAGCAFLATFAGSWMGNFAVAVPGVAVAGLIVCTGVIVIDVAIDGKPDGFAFWAAFGLAAFVGFGLSGLPMAGNQIGDGFTQVGDQVQQVSR